MMTLQAPRPVSGGTKRRRVLSYRPDRRTILVLSLLLLAAITSVPVAALDPETSLDQYSRDSWVEDEGLPQNSVQTIIQTADGYLWVGTQEGLARFDGVRFSVLDRRSSPGLQVNHVEVALQAGDGSLWVGTFGGGLTHFRDDSDPITWGSDSELATTQVLLEDDDGTIWAGSVDGLFRIRGDHLTGIAMDELPSHDVHCLLRDSSRRLWVGTASGLAQLQDDEIVPYQISDLPPAMVSAMVEDHDGTLWIGTEAGLAKVRKGRLLAFGDSDGLPSQPVWALYLEPGEQGSLWVGTKAGLYRLRRQGQLEVTLIGTAVQALLEDREGSLWIGTQAEGLVRFKTGKALTFAEAQGLTDEFLYCVTGSGRGGLWVGTIKGQIDYFDGSRFTNVVPAERFHGERVRALLEDDRGTLWIGTNGGLSTYRDGRLEPIDPWGVTPRWVVRALCRDQEGGIWIGSDGGGVARLRDGRVDIWTTEQGLAGNRVRTILAGIDGEIWIGTYSGLSRFADGRFTSLDRDDGLSTSFVRSLYQDEDQTLWIGTYGGGLNRLKDGVISRFTIQDGLFNNVVFHILPDASGRLWMTCNRGIYSISKEDLAAYADGRLASLRCTVYGRADGMLSRECNGGNPGAWRAADGRLWFPTARGLVMINPEHPRRNELQPPVVIESLEVDGVLTEPPAARVAAGTKRIALRFTALSLVAPERNRFRFMLAGYDDDWVEAGTRRVAYYTGVPPGHYTFKVIASNNDSVWNRDGAVLNLVVEPYYYETWWFKGLIALLVVMAGALGYRLRVRFLEQRQRQLEKLVEARTRQLEEQTAELKRLNEKKNEFLGIAAHDLRSPLANVSGFTRLLLRYLETGNRDDAKWQRHLQCISTTTTQMRALIDDLLDVAAIESGRVEMNMTRIDMADVIEQAAKLYGEAAQAKGIELIVDPARPNVEVTADRTRITEVLDNLISNALKFTSPGGEVEISCEAGDHEVAVHVRDTGQGLEPNELSRVFTGRRLSATPTAGETSTRLGLVIVRKILELHGGRAWVESAKGKGSTFSFNLPRLQ